MYFGIYVLIFSFIFIVKKVFICNTDLLAFCFLIARLYTAIKFLINEKYIINVNCIKPIAISIRETVKIYTDFAKTILL